MELENIKQRIITLVNDGKEILIRWDCGGDQRFLDVVLDGEQLDRNDDFAVDLELLVINVLSLPSASELYINGVGILLIENSAIVLKHASRCYEEDWDDEQHKWINIDKESINGKITLLPL